MKIIALILLSLIAGCAATGPTFTPATDLSDSAAIIYVYRPARAANSGGYPLITLNSEVKGPLKNAGYLAIRVPAGTHVVEQQYSVWNWDMRAKPVVIEAKPKRRYFIKLDTDVSSALALPAGSFTMISITRNLYFGQVDDKTGMTEIRDLKLSQ
jgi:hypothetical protein